MIKYEKSNFYRNMLIQAKGNTRKLWSCLNEVIGKPSSCIPRVLNTDSGLLTDALELANFLNTYFINIASQVTAHLPPSTDYAPSTQFNDFLLARLPGKPKFSLPHISVDNVLSYLNNLNVRTSAGLDNIRVSLLKMASPNLILPLCNIINTSIIHGFYPSSWKAAKVFALHKGGSSSDANNFRPISILSVTSKILEKHVHDSFYLYLSTNDLICHSQFGFRKNYSCFTCLASLVNEWYNIINKDMIVGCIALDLGRLLMFCPTKFFLKNLLCMVVMKLLYLGFILTYQIELNMFI